MPLPANFPQRLKSARLIKGYSMRELSAKLGGKLSANALSRYEKGIMEPTSANFIALCKALGVSTSFFSRQPMELEAVEFRKLSNLPAKRQKQIIEQASDFLSRYVELETLLAVESTFRLPEGYPYPVNGKEDVEAFTKKLRSDWNLGYDPIPKVVELLESKEIKVHQISTEARFDGMAAKTQAGGNTHYIIVLNTFDRQPVRVRFTALHELAHILMDLSSITDEQTKERLCHYAAGAILLPQNSLVDLLGAKRRSINIRELIDIKEQYGIALSAILYRAQSAGIITEAYRNNQMKYFSMRGWRSAKEPGSYCVPEKSNRMQRLVLRGIEEGIISETKGANLFGMTTARFDDWLDKESVD